MDFIYSAHCPHLTHFTTFPHVLPKSHFFIPTYPSTKHPSFNLQPPRDRKKVLNPHAHVVIGPPPSRHASRPSAVVHKRAMSAGAGGACMGFFAPNKPFPPLGGRWGLRKARYFRYLPIDGTFLEGVSAPRIFLLSFTLLYYCRYSAKYATILDAILYGVKT